MKNKLLVVICALIFLGGIIGSAAVLLTPNNNTVRIISGGKVIETVDLSAAPDRTFDVEYEGRTNTIEIKGGRIRVLSAECPDKTCVHMGWLSSSAVPVVCLPNHLVIEFAGDTGGVDTVSE